MLKVRHMFKTLAESGSQALDDLTLACMTDPPQFHAVEIFRSFGLKEKKELVAGHLL